MKEDYNKALFHLKVYVHIWLYVYFKKMFTTNMWFSCGGISEKIVKLQSSIFSIANMEFV